MVFHIQVSSANGKQTLMDMAPNATVQELILKTFPNENDLAVERVRILKGSPPAPVHVQRGDETLAEIGISNGAQLTLEKRAPPELQRVSVPANNSCLFTAINFCLSGNIDPVKATFMRELVAATVMSDRTNFTESVLGKPNEEYAEFITKESSWGGAIETQILADYFGVVITVVVAQSATLTHFGDEKQYGQRLFLLYKDNHYDPLCIEQDGCRITLFPTNDTTMLEKATVSKLCRERNGSPSEPMVT